MRRTSPILPVVVFASKRGKQYTGFVYSNGTWFQMLGRIGDDPRLDRLLVVSKRPKRVGP